MQMTVQALVASDLDLGALAQLRSEAWREKYPSYAVHVDDWTDHYEETSDHFAAIIGDEIVGAARLSYVTQPEHNDQFAHLPGFYEFIKGRRPPLAVFSRLVVRPAYRGKGVARALDLKRLDVAHAKEISTGLILVHAGSRRFAAVQDLGFKMIPGAENFSGKPFKHARFSGPGASQSGSALYVTL